MAIISVLRADYSNMNGYSPNFGTDDSFDQEIFTCFKVYYHS